MEESNFVRSQGKKNNRLNVITPEFKFDNWKTHIKDSGEKLADIVFGTLDDYVNLSLKNDKSQTTGLGCSDILRRGFKVWKETGIKPKDGLIWYNNFCERLGMTDLEFYKWYRSNSNSTFISPDNDQLSKFCACVIGGGYYYINSNGTIIEIPNDYELPYCEFYEIRKAKPKDGKSIKTIYIIGKINGINCKIVFRSSDGKPYPNRFFLKPDNEEDLEKIYRSLK